MKSPSMPHPRSLLKRLIDLAFVVALVHLLFVLLAGCSRHPGSKTETIRPSTPTLTTPTVIADRKKQFARNTRFVGRVEAARSSDLGFELAGTLLAAHVDEGNAVEKGDLLAELDTARLNARSAELEAAKEEAKAAVQLAEVTFERMKSLVKRKAISRQALDEALQNRDSTRAAVRRTEAQLHSVDVDLSKSKLTAPFAGTISARLLDEGAIVTPGKPLFRILETANMEIRAGLSATAASGLELGQTVDVQTRDSRSLPVVVERILPQRHPDTRTVDVIFRSSGSGLRDGDLISIPINTPVQTEGFWLPRMALIGSTRGLWSCYVAERANDETRPGMRRVEKRELEILHQEGDRVFVKGGLREGDHVITSGVHRLVVGQFVLDTTGTLARSENPRN